MKRFTQAELRTIYEQLRTEIDTAFETQARLEENQEDVSIKFLLSSMVYSFYRRIIPMSTQRGRTTWTGAPTPR